MFRWVIIMFCCAIRAHFEDELLEMLLEFLAMKEAGS